MRKPGTGAQARRSDPSEALRLQMRAAKLPEPVEEHLFGRGIGRRWRFDFAWPYRLFAVEVEGGVYMQGRHTRGSGFTKDIEKYNAATLLGWRVLRATPEHIRTGAALKAIEEALDRWREPFPHYHPPPAKDEACYCNRPEAARPGNPGGEK